jgi:phospholipase C
MMENRSFDHMLGALKAKNPAIDGLTGAESNPDTAGNKVVVQNIAEFQSQLDPDPDHHFPAVDLQIFNGDPARVPNMQGFVKSYFNQRRDLAHSQKIMYYFTPENIPGPTICNRAFAHYGTSFGKVAMDLFYVNEPFKSIYNRLIDATPKHTAKLYYYDQTSSTMEIVNLLQHQPELFGTYKDFLDACKKGELPDYCFVEPNYNDHEGDDGEELASDQHPDHNVQAGESFIATIYQAIKNNADLWKSTALRHRHRHRVQVRPPRRSRSRHPDLSLDSQRHGHRRPHLRTRLHPSHRHQAFPRNLRPAFSPRKGGRNVSRSADVAGLARRLSCF